jgi:hypothetical protein
MQLIMSIGLIVAGLFLALIVNYDDASSADDMRLFGWVLFGTGILGLILKFLLSVLGGQDRR